ncbi:SDR family oxidoreductase [Meiothermus taiwanensis]|jgi:NAD(P)-dependent dehydrogenase (short-subunit alcohol dehydrogenase family)|uniref:Short-chain dehydrogenase/reductase SDR n=2 Tax=Meiothermus taiwanensis TaxID=172827 RepID=A0ABM6WGC1_9DEIN|nr:SDR family oxidoreductase [Meiothermus taiwanensis]AWR86046.1 short-chain dehydrogenase/reductase SDR [Meiothermus taiwanensis WR-220]KIQ55216.1 2,4-dienoyl-CoA reductase [Meiothermus taiwanensis]KZK14916.1 2,4-dienoyl-CoA reductase [Meiothermus taiwanensis]RIH75214.1 putative 2,4-dienoyl-CoA reductase [Meiothermus taiwanensis]
MFEPGLLKDKVVLVTGGGTGLGRSMSTRFLELGAKVAITSRRAETIAQAAQEMMEQTGGEVFATPVDVRDPEAVRAMIDAVEAHFGRIDVLINNAAGNFISPTERLSYRAFDAVLNIVLHGTVYCTLEVGKRWIARGHKGTMLNIATTYAQTGSGYVVPSATAKAGVVALTKSLAAEWGKYGIRLNAIAPGPFPTEGAWTRLMPTPEIAQMFEKKIPLGRVGQHIELANLAAYLISDYAGFITGDVITIDGGETVWNAGEFNVLDAVTKEQWDMLEAMRKKG